MEDVGAQLKAEFIEKTLPNAMKKVWHHFNYGTTTPLQILLHGGLKPEDVAAEIHGGTLWESLNAADDNTSEKPLEIFVDDEEGAITDCTGYSVALKKLLDHTAQSVGAEITYISTNTHTALIVVFKDARYLVDCCFFDQPILFLPNEFHPSTAATEAGNLYYLAPNDRLIRHKRKKDDDPEKMFEGIEVPLKPTIALARYPFYVLLIKGQYPEIEHKIVFVVNPVGVKMRAKDAKKDLKYKLTKEGDRVKLTKKIAELKLDTSQDLKNI